MVASPAKGKQNSAYNPPQPKTKSATIPLKGIVAVLIYLRFAALWQTTP